MPKRKRTSPPRLRRLRQNKRRGLLQIHLELPQDSDRHSLDLNDKRPIKAVLVDTGDGFLACGIQLAVYAYGADADDALGSFVEACSETYAAVCEQINVDLACVFGRSDPYFMRAAEDDVAEREMPSMFFGRA